MKEIHKIVAIVVRDNMLLMVRKVGKDIWTSLGGKPEAGETEEEALLREIQEEVHCGGRVIRKLGDFSAPAVFDDAIVKLSAYLVELDGEPKLDDPELEECAFIPKDYKEKGIKLPPSLEDEILPFLVGEKLLDW
ncbi:MAG: NUDIX domain-containing protein [Candidatus Aenigmatarchaeota archaeon]|nr:MAG: NUDIX domain-containing protein [Candidatus Aenigmarchaeota archaeon]